MTREIPRHKIYALFTKLRSKSENHEANELLEHKSMNKSNYHNSQRRSNSSSATPSCQSMHFIFVSLFLTALPFLCPLKKCGNAFQTFPLLRCIRTYLCSYKPWLCISADLQICYYLYTKSLRK